MRRRPLPAPYPPLPHTPYPSAYPPPPPVTPLYPPPPTHYTRPPTLEQVFASNTRHVEYLRSFGRYGNRPGEFNKPMAIAAVRDALVVGEFTGRRVQAILSSIKQTPFPPFSLPPFYEVSPAIPAHMHHKLFVLPFFLSLSQFSHARFSRIFSHPPLGAHPFRDASATHFEAVRRPRRPRRLLRVQRQGRGRRGI